MPSPPHEVSNHLQRYCQTLHSISCKHLFKWRKIRGNLHVIVVGRLPWSDSVRLLDNFVMAQNVRATSNVNIVSVGEL